MRRCDECRRPTRNPELCDDCSAALAAESPAPVARCECGERFADPAEAARHWADSSHTTWSVPSAWLAGRPWAQPEFWRSLLDRTER